MTKTPRNNPQFSLPTRRGGERQAEEYPGSAFHPSLFYTNQQLHDVDQIFIVIQNKKCILSVPV